MNNKTNDRPDESGIVMQATNSINIIPFDPNNSMNVNSWLKYFNDKCQEYNLDDKWKLNNITAYLKNIALTEYVNSYDIIKTWEEFISFLTERQNNNYQTPPHRQNFRPFSNANTHFKDKLPPSPCCLCTKQGIANAYHWVQTCPFGLSAGQLLSPNPAPPNFDPPKEENQQ
ncbi:hypothetical protein AVEN_158354-1 [Araneus ventricosus]|uniref:Uncharacterized protein n=1 Tax=Araneus ventricosus TaxID=182803 RepID=A0A4Y2FCY4_ARAVE|nr:hypothetical protein AVEN_158354-1 [Araneus ventricosus]